MFLADFISRSVNKSCDDTKGDPDLRVDQDIASVQLESISEPLTVSLPVKLHATNGDLSVIYTPNSPRTRTTTDIPPATEHSHSSNHNSNAHVVSEPNPLRPLRDLQYGLGEMVFGGCRHLEYMNIWSFNEPK